MSDYSDIITVNITKNTLSLARANFGTVGIISEFPATKTIATFDRERIYNSKEAMLSDGFKNYDLEYIAATRVFQQTPTVKKIRLGRKKPASEAVESWTDALTAIDFASPDWYGYTVITDQKIKIVFTNDFITGNSIVATVNGTAVSAVPFTTNHLTTIQALKTEIEADVTGSSVTIDPADVTNRTIIITTSDNYVDVSFVITGGISQTTYTRYKNEVINEASIKEIALWNSTKEKLYLFGTDSSDVITNSTTDIASYVKGLSYQNVVSSFHPQYTTNNEFLQLAWLGAMLWQQPGSATWANKTLVGVTPYRLTASQKSYADGKNCNTAVDRGGLNNTEPAKVAVGEWIDVIWGQHWLTANIQEELFRLLKLSNKIPQTDEGISRSVATCDGVCQTAVNNLFLSSYKIEAVPQSEVTTADKEMRLYKGITINGILAGAIHFFEVNINLSI